VSDHHHRHWHHHHELHQQQQQQQQQQKPKQQQKRQRSQQSAFAIFSTSLHGLRALECKLADSRRPLCEYQQDITSADSTLSSPIFARLGKGPGAGASDYFKYSLQLNVYKLLLERCYKLPGKIEHMFIVQLHPNLDRGLRVHQVQNMHQEMALIQEYLENSARYQWVD
jgi:hypothetical protein